MTAIFLPCCSDRMRLISVVLPEPRKAGHDGRRHDGALFTWVVWSAWHRGSFFGLNFRTRNCRRGFRDPSASRSFASGRSLAAGWLAEPRGARHASRSAAAATRFGASPPGGRDDRLRHRGDLLLEDHLAVRRRQHVTAQLIVGHHDPAGAAPDALAGHALEADRRLGQHRPDVDQPGVLVELLLPGQLVVDLLARPEGLQVGLRHAGRMMLA